MNIAVLAYGSGWRWGWLVMTWPSRGRAGPRSLRPSRLTAAEVSAMAALIGVLPEVPR